jgi:hypothetical protein
MPKQTRVIFPLLKAPITEIMPHYVKIHIGAQYGAPTTITIKCQTDMYDLRDGDMLTIYTEVLLKEPKGAS